DTGDLVGAAAGRERTDHLDRPRRLPALRGGERGQGAKKAEHNRRFRQNASHGILPGKFVVLIISRRQWRRPSAWCWRCRLGLLSASFPQQSLSLRHFASAVPL